MGYLSDFDLGKLITDYGCRYLIETGTGGGAGVEYAATFDFDHIYSVEIMHKLAIRVALKHSKNQKITIIHGKSERGLREAIEEIPADVPVLYWLDAHFPGADFKLASYDAEKDETVRLPLEREMRLLAELRDVSRDVFLIDDLRIYEDGPYGDGPAAIDKLPAQAEWRSVAFVDDILGKTHRIDRLYDRTGYLCAFPKK